MDDTIKEMAIRLLNTGYDDLPPHEQRVLRRIAKRIAISENINTRFNDNLTFGQRMADRVAAFGGSWSFIILFAVVLLVWVSMNAWFLARVDAFDPYPFIFLNLILSMLAAIQAPIIMMSQNRQAAKDRVEVNHDYEVNLKAELEIMSLHEKFDELQQHQLEAILQKQNEQLEELRQLSQKLDEDNRKK
ncbi:DUF1003 domain-containing protein [Sneathiella sp.]|uniref:DUF1003 domain-containing protein n=1 Tax=Sneathiella sp. TaxID=1964365 RepID=UPI00356453C4